MKQKSIILLSIIACIGGVIFFIACRRTYEYKVDELKQIANKTFKEMLLQELKSREANDGQYRFHLAIEKGLTGVSDTVCVEEESGRSYYLIDDKKEDLNITDDVNQRCIHSIVLVESPHVTDSLYVKWKKKLLAEGVNLESALRISLKNKEDSVYTTQNTQLSEWNESSISVFTHCIGYAHELIVTGYMHYTIWNLIGKELIICILLYVAFISGFYVLIRTIHRNMHLIRRKEIVEIIKEVPKIITKEVPIEIIKEIHVEKQVVKEVQRVDCTELRSYRLGDNILFYADQNIILINDVEHKIQAQSALLLELFLKQKENDYILKEQFILDTLWVDHSRNNGRLHSAVGRLRTFIKNIGLPFIIINKGDTYQLIIKEDPPVK